MGEALEAICINYAALVMLLEEIVAREEDPVAAGLLNQLSQYRVVATLHLCTDSLKLTNNLSKLFQYRDIAFGAVSRGVS